jgi:hypothetical protein
LDFSCGERTDLPIRPSDLLANRSPIDVSADVANLIAKVWVAKAWGANACARHSQPIRPNDSGIATCSW